MKLKSIFKKTPVTKPEVKEAAGQVKPEVPEGLLKRCNKCGKGIFTEDYKKNLYICPKCGGYLRMPAQKRIDRKSTRLNSSHPLSSRMPSSA